MSRTIPFFNYPALFRSREKEILDFCRADLDVLEALTGRELLMWRTVERP